MDSPKTDEAKGTPDESHPDPLHETDSAATDASPPMDSPKTDEKKSLFFGDRTKTALVCDDMPENQDMLRTVLEEMDYYVHATDEAEATLDKMRFNKYDVIILNEEFAGCDPSDNEILKYIQLMSMDTRREMFFALIGKEFRTYDYMTAFSKSTNIVINANDLPDIKKVLTNALEENEKFYKVLKETLSAVGKR